MPGLTDVIYMYLSGQLKPASNYNINIRPSNTVHSFIKTYNHYTYYGITLPDVKKNKIMMSFISQIITSLNLDFTV